MFLEVSCKINIPSSCLHRQQNRYPDLSDIDMAIPIYHAFGHKGSCQVCTVLEKGLVSEKGVFIIKITHFIYEFSALCIVTACYPPPHRVCRGI